jgi:2-polyprenyl-6-methoxyphenol hydroxylase-like FAD-dependent oxidoreductase
MAVRAIGIALRTLSVNQTDVLIVGAGPTGLVLALWLIKQSVSVRIIDKTTGPGTTSRALAVQARTLELYRQLDLTDDVLQRGHKVPAINLWVKGKSEARISFETITDGLTPYGPFIYPQDQHERLLIEHLERLGSSVERGTELMSFSETADRVAAIVHSPHGTSETYEAKFLAGCDGAHSIVRQTIGIGFSGGAYQQLFYVADVEASGPAINGELHVDLDEADFLMVFPLKGHGRARLVGTVRGERALNSENLTLGDVSDRARDNMKVDVQKVNWFSTYHVHHRIAERFRKSRAFLLGDAAHIHSPAGGQGMNTGIGDAINLAWKLKAVLTDQASDALLNSYEIERQAFARKLVATTDKGFTLATAQGHVADFMRTRIVPIIVPTLFKFESAREYMFSAVSQIAVSYRDSPFSAGTAGNIRGGDRLPWAPTSAVDNFDALRTIAWQIHVYGTATTELTNWSASNNIELHQFAWQEAYGKSGLARNAMYLVRPDTYVALAAEKQDLAILTSYFSDHELSLPRQK